MKLITKIQAPMFLNSIFPISIGRNIWHCIGCINVREMEQVSDKNGHENVLPH